MTSIAPTPFGPFRRTRGDTCSSKRAAFCGRATALNATVTGSARAASGERMRTFGCHTFEEMHRASLARGESAPDHGLDVVEPTPTDALRVGLQPLFSDQMIPRRLRNKGRPVTIF